MPDEHRDLAFRFGADIGITAAAVRAWALWHLGYPDQARLAAAEALRQARQSVHRHTLAYALIYSGFTAISGRDAAEVARNGNELVDWTREHGFALFLVYGLMSQGWAMAHQGHGIAAIERIREGMKVCADTGARCKDPTSGRIGRNSRADRQGRGRLGAS